MANPLRLFPTEDETIEGTGRALRKGRRTCREVLEQCFERIEEWEPKVRAWVIVDRNGALEQARKLDDELTAGKCRGPLHGIPIGIKDIIDVAGLPTACGAKHWADGPAQTDAALVAKLREAGAVILGKTVTTPYAWVDPPVTRNPWNLDHTPGGSSSGSAAAVACGMCLGAIGTQTGGSITRPASFCGIAGHKPTHLGVETEGILPFAPALDHPGPLARSVSGLVALQQVIGRFPSGGPGASYLSSRTLYPKTATDRPPESFGPPPRVGCLDGPFREMAEPSMRDAIDEAIAVLIMNGAEVVKTPLPVDFEAVIAAHRVIMAAQAAAFHQERLSESPDDYPPRIEALLREGLGIAAVDYIRSEERGVKQATGVAELLSRVDVLVTPAALGPAPDPSTTGNPAFNSPWSLWGMRTTTFPIGLAPNGLPLGVQLIGTADLFDDEDRHFRAALWCEDAIRRAYESRSQ
ncbi:MAG: amidase [Isosphaeraceae bacterium]|nr:amidase [Isosphaeraceae bacterium]